MLDAGIAQGLLRPARRLLLQLAQPQRGYIVLLLILLIAQALLNAVTPWLVAIAIDGGIPAARQANYWPLFGIGAALALCAVGLAILSQQWRKRAGEIGQLIMFDLRRQLFAKLQSQPVAFHERLSSGRIIARLTADAESVNVLFAGTLAGLLQAMLGIVAMTVAMLLLNVTLATITFAALLPMAALIAWNVRQLRKTFEQNRAAVADMTVQVVESLNGIRAVHAFRRHGRNDELLDTHAERGRIAGRRIQVVRGLFFPTMELIFSLAALIVVLVGGLQVSRGTLEIGVLAAFVIYIAQFFMPLVGMSWFLDALQQALTALGKIAEVMETSSSVPEPPHPIALPKPMRGEVVFESVQFGYGASTGAAVAGGLAIPMLDLRLDAGHVVAVLGATGAGKSTIAKLIARFYDPTAGRVLLDGVDLRDVTDRDLRGAVTLLTQEGFLFAGSVADNIRISRPTAAIEEVEAAAKAVGADAFIRALPDGYDTNVRKRGTRLSAGQRQMIAFAQAFLANPAVLILDEATAALDIPTERAMQSALRTLLAGRTALIIAHRLSTLEIADRLLVVGDGRIVEDGTPAELRARGTGEFAALYRDGHGLSLRGAAETSTSAGTGRSKDQNNPLGIDT